MTNLEAAIILGLICAIMIGVCWALDRLLR
jgi:hypothetical protein